MKVPAACRLLHDHKALAGGQSPGLVVNYIEGSKLMVNIPGTDRILLHCPLALHETQSFAADPVLHTVTSARLRLRGLLLGCLALLFTSTHAHAQQFNADNQWTAPHGVGTVVGTVGEEYSTAVLVAALFPDWEFNVGVTSYYGDLESQTDTHNTGTFYVKKRIFENEQQTGGLAFMGGTGVDPSHLEAGVVTDTFKSWWGNLVYTIPFRDGQVTWDLLPGVLVNMDQDNRDDTAWGFTYSSRLAIYDIIPQSAIVAEVFGTAGEAKSDPRYRFGVRWESKKFVIAATYSDAFDGSGGAGFEIGFIYFTEPRFCFGGCRR